MLRWTSLLIFIKIEQKMGKKLIFPKKRHSGHTFLWLSFKFLKLKKKISKNSHRIIFLYPLGRDSNFQNLLRFLLPEAAIFFPVYLKTIEKKFFLKKCIIWLKFGGHCFPSKFSKNCHEFKFSEYQITYILIFDIKNLMKYMKNNSKSASKLP